MNARRLATIPIVGAAIGLVAFGVVRGVIPAGPARGIRLTVAVDPPLDTESRTIAEHVTRARLEEKGSELRIVSDGDRFLVEIGDSNESFIDDIAALLERTGKLELHTSTGPDTFDPAVVLEGRAIRHVEHVDGGIAIDVGAPSVLAAFPIAAPIAFVFEGRVRLVATPTRLNQTALLVPMAADDTEALQQVLEMIAMLETGAAHPLHVTKREPFSRATGFFPRAWPFLAAGLVLLIIAALVWWRSGAALVLVLLVAPTSRARADDATPLAPHSDAPPKPAPAPVPRHQDEPGKPAPAAKGPSVPDASLRAVTQHVVRLELDGAPAVEGRVLAFEPTTVTLALSQTNEVVTLPRDHLAHVIAIESPVSATTPAASDKLRVFSLQFSLLGTVAADADYKLFHGFASTSLLLPIMTASGNSPWLAAALGAGVSLPLGTTSRWKLDVFGEVLPLRTTSYYTYLGFGVGAGFHYTASSGFTLGFTMPVLGFSTRLGSSPYGYDASFRYNDSVGYFYLAGLAGMPIVTMGYRFECARCK